MKEMKYKEKMIAPSHHEIPHLVGIRNELYDRPGMGYLP